MTYGIMLQRFIYTHFKLRDRMMPYMKDFFYENKNISDIHLRPDIISK